MNEIERHHRNVIDSCERNRDFQLLEDGFHYFWARERGALSSADLRVIANELDRRNQRLEKQLEYDLGRD